MRDHSLISREMLCLSSEQDTRRVEALEVEFPEETGS